MATTLSVNSLTLQLGWDYESTAYPANVKDVNSVSYTGPTLTNGTGANQANIKYSASITLAALATTSLNLQSLTDGFGNSLNFARIKDLYVENSSVSSASAITVGSATTNTFCSVLSAGNINIRNGAHAHLGVAADATAWPTNSGNQMEIANLDGSNAATVKISIIGANA